MDPVTMSAIIAAVGMLGGGAAAALNGGDWWSGNTTFTDNRKGRDAGFYNSLQGQQADQYSGIQNLLGAINQNTQNYGVDMGSLQSLLRPYENQFQQLGNQIAGYTGQFENLQNQLGRQGTTQLGIMREMNDPASYLKYMTNLSGQSANLANNAYKNMFGDYENNASAYTADAANRARTSAASQLANSGLLNTGAALDAISGAGVSEQLRAASELANLRGQMTGQTYNNLMGQGSSAYQNQASNAVSGMNALSNLFGERSNILGNAVSTLGQTGNQYGNAANIINSLINARNSQFSNELSGLGTQLNSRQNLWGNLLSAISQDQQYESNAVHTGGLRDYLLGLSGGSGQTAGMSGQSALNGLSSLFSSGGGAGAVQNPYGGYSPGFTFNGGSNDYIGQILAGLGA